MLLQNSIGKFFIALQSPASLNIRINMFYQKIIQMIITSVYRYRKKTTSNEVAVAFRCRVPRKALKFCESGFYKVIKIPKMNIGSIKSGKVLRLAVRAFRNILIHFERKRIDNID